MKINPLKVEGVWDEGWALDYHTLYSIYLGYGLFDTERTEIGEALFLLKYREDLNQIEKIANAAADFIRNNYLKKASVSAIIPVPPSIDRDLQPVTELAKVIGGKLNLKVDFDYLKKIKSTLPAKDFPDLTWRRKELKDAFVVKDLRYKSKTVIVFDDLIGSGITMTEITRTLKKQGKVAKVFVLAITKTRTKK